MSYYLSVEVSKDFELIFILISRFQPIFFEKDIDSGIPKLTAEGRKAVEEELAEPEPHCIEDHDGAITEEGES